MFSGLASIVLCSCSIVFSADREDLVRTAYYNKRRMKSLKGGNLQKLKNKDKAQLLNPTGILTACLHSGSRFVYQYRAKFRGRARRGNARKEEVPLLEGLNGVKRVA